MSVPSSELGLPHCSLSPASVCAPLEPKGGGGYTVHTRLRVRGWGSPNSDDWMVSWYYCTEPPCKDLPASHMSCRSWYECLEYFWYEWVNGIWVVVAWFIRTRTLNIFKSEESPGTSTINNTATYSAQCFNRKKSIVFLIFSIIVFFYEVKAYKLTSKNKSILWCTRCKIDRHVAAPNNPPPPQSLFYNFEFITCTKVLLSN